MQTLDMTFFEEFKRLENVCNDCFSCKSGVTEYIAQMEQGDERGRAAVPGWTNDYKTLKHLRWLRNQIAHEADSGAICKPEELQALRAFYSRLLSGEDPLTRLTRAGKKAPAKKQKAPPVRTETAPKAAAIKPGAAKRGRTPQKPEKATRKRGGSAWALVFVILLAVLALAALAALYLDSSGRLSLSELWEILRSGFRKLPETLHPISDT